jgi:hypothetical protein
MRTITGYAGTCSGPSLGTNPPPIIYVTVDGHTETIKGPSQDTAFSITINRCSATRVPVTIVAVDPNTGDSSTQSLTPGDTSIFMADTGTLNLPNELYACKQDQWIVASVSSVYSKPDPITYTPLGFGGYDPSWPFRNISVGVATSIMGAGNYAINSFFGGLSSSPVYTGGHFGGTVTVSSFGPIGGYIIGTFTVRTQMTSYMPDTLQSPLTTVTGYFQVKRTQ